MKQSLTGTAIKYSPASLGMSDISTTTINIYE
jgi:hypothetical protein